MKAPLAALGEVADFIRGITFKPDDIIELGGPNSVACLRTRNVQADLDLTDVWALPESFVKSPDRLARRGDVILSTANSWNLVGKASWVPELPWPTTAGGFVSLLRAKSERLDPRYMYHWTSSPLTQARLRKCARRTTNISNLSIPQAKELTIPLPPLKEQKRIAGILDQAAELCRLRTRALDKLSTLGQAIFHEMFGASDGGIREWPTATLGELVADAQIGAVRGANEMSDEKACEYLRMDAIGTDGSLNLNDLRCVDASDHDLEKYGLRRGDLLFNTRNSKELVGKTAVLRQDFGGIYNNNILRCRFVLPSYADFFDAYLRTATGSRSLENIKSGTTSVFAVYQKALMSLRVPVPDESLTNEFASKLMASHAFKSEYERGIGFSESLFASLQHRAFRGEL